MAIGDGANLGVNTSIQSATSLSSLVSATSTNVGLGPTLPWVSSGIDSAFFRYINIAPDLWDELLPYRLLVIDATTNTIVSTGAGSTSPSNIKLTVTPGTGSALVEFLSATPLWIFQLPISPQQLTIQDNYAIKTTATLRGVMEEHSGVRFKIINAQGTMGIWPQRGSVTKPSTTPNVLQSVFGGTINAAQGVANSISNVINIASGNHPANKPTSIRPTASNSNTTGYYQALQLQQFLEQYAEAKKDPKNASWRLVFDIPKQNQSYIVTPMVYNWQQNANKPLEFLYNFQLKAWRRIDLSQTVTPTPANNQPLSPGILQRILGTLAAARQTMSGIQNLLAAVTSDIEAPLNVLRQTVLFVKDLAGVVATSADLPDQIVKAYQSQISTSLSILSSTIQSTITDPVTIKALNAILTADAVFEGLTQAAVAGGQLGTISATSYTLAPANAIFAQPAAYYTLLDQVPVTSLSLTTVQQNEVNQLITTASQTTVATLKQYRATILKLALQLSNIFGTGSAYYNSLYNLPPVATNNLPIPITLDNYAILDSLYEVMASLDILTATTQVDDNNIQTAMEFVAGLAANAGIEFNETTSKIMVPVPRSLSIEQISARYLSDPQRWLEIVTLNDLREPYIDENGFQLMLLSNAVGREIVVADDTYLYIGQQVILNSMTQTMQVRTVLNIRMLSPTSYLVSLDGLANLENFLVGDGAYIQIYLPQTVNSQQKIYIPSDLPIPNLPNIIPPPGTSGDPLTALSKVDWLLTEEGDIAITSYGDWMYSYGLTNIIQALRIKFGTQSGKLLLDPTFGLNVTPGKISSEVQLQQLYNSINEMILQDPRFSGIYSLQIFLNGPTLGINVAVTIPGQTGVYPISFALTNN
jgi:hypothetical protein